MSPYDNYVLNVVPYQVLQRNFHESRIIIDGSSASAI
jgi:hypothetical protein